MSSMRYFPMSDLQRHWWDQEESGRNPDFVINRRWLLKGSLQASIVESACRRVIARHEALRTSFEVLNGEHYQVVHEAPTNDTYWTDDLTGLEEAQGNQALVAILQREREMEFDLGLAPLIRVRLIILPNDKTVISVTVHHIIADGFALDLIWDELSTYCAVPSDGAQPSDRPPPQLHEWTERERTFAASAAGGREMAYWSTVLGEHTRTQLPPDREGDGHYISEIIQVPLNRAVTDRLASRSISRRVTPSIIYMSTLLKTLAQGMNKNRASTKILLQRRRAPGVAGLVGCVFTGAVISVDFGTADQDPLREIMLASKALIEANSHSNLTAERIWPTTGFPTEAVDVLFIFDAESGTDARTFGGLEAEEYSLPQRNYERVGSRWENLKVRVQGLHDGVVLIVEYNSLMYQRSSIDNFLEGYVSNLADYTSCLLQPDLQA